MNSNLNHTNAHQESKWRLKIGSQAHGPYSINQMRSLVLQGLLAPHSQISPVGADEWRAANEEPDIAIFFHETQSKFGQRTSTPATASTETKTESTNFILIVDVQADSNADLEQAIMRLGRASYIMRNTWILNGRYTISAVRNALIPYLRSMDSLFIVDINHGKNAWFNLGLEVESKIRQIWKGGD